MFLPKVVVFWALPLLITDTQPEKGSQPTPIKHSAMCSAGECSTRATTVWGVWTTNSVYIVSGKCLTKLHMRYVYLVRNGKGNFKVGLATSVDARVKELQTANPDRLEIVAVKATEKAEALEAWLHDYLQDRRSGGGTEWFTLTDTEALEVVVLMYQEPSAFLAVDTRFGRVNISMDLTNQALDVFREVGRVSTSLLQHRLHVGYARAARTMDSLIADGHVIIDEETQLRKLAA